jgi:4-hydroxy-tetrahydrodipicolinate synthase
MKPARTKLELSGVYAAAVTPNRAGTLEVDYTGLLDLIDFLAAGGVNGICLMGSTGEFAKYSCSDRQRTIYLAKKRSRVPLIVGVGHTCLTGALGIADDAVQAGADALLLMPPFFFPYGQPEIEAFYREFARELGNSVPIMLYNIPQFTSGIAVDTARRLLDTGLFAGIKDSGGDWACFEELLRFKQQRGFVLFAGNDRIAARAVQEGADGVLSGCASAIPELLVALCKAAGAGDEARVQSLNANLTEFIEWIEKFPAPVGIKRAVAARGQKSGENAVPLSAETASELEAFAVWFQAWNRNW